MIYVGCVQHLNLDRIPYMTAPPLTFMILDFTMSRIKKSVVFLKRESRHIKVLNVSIPVVTFILTSNYIKISLNKRE